MFCIRRDYITRIRANSNNNNNNKAKTGPTGQRNTYVDRAGRTSVAGLTRRALTLIVRPTASATAVTATTTSYEQRAVDGARVRPSWNVNTATITLSRVSVDDASAATVCPSADRVRGALSSVRWRHGPPPPSPVAFSRTRYPRGRPLLLYSSAIRRIVRVAQSSPKQPNDRRHVFLFLPLLSRW